MAWPEQGDNVQYLLAWKTGHIPPVVSLHAQRG